MRRPNDSGSPADKAKEPPPPRSVVQCVVASTPAITGSGLAGRVVLLAPAGPCCFRLDELVRILLRIAKTVNYYVIPLAIVAGFQVPFYLTPLAIVRARSGRLSSLRSIMQT